MVRPRPLFFLFFAVLSKTCHSFHHPPRRPSYRRHYDRAIIVDVPLPIHSSSPHCYNYGTRRTPPSPHAIGARHGGTLLLSPLFASDNVPDPTPTVSGNRRRATLQTLTAATLLSLIVPLPAVEPARADVIDDTSTFAPSFPYQSPPRDTAADVGGTSTTTTTPPPADDEITITLPLSSIRTGGLGIELGEISFRTNRRVIVKTVRPDSLASRSGIRPDWIVVRVNSQSAERTDAKGVQIMVSRALSSDGDDGSLTLTFRDPGAFREAIRGLSQGEGEVVTTQVAPAGDTTQRNADGSVKGGVVGGGGAVTSQSDQRLSVSQLIPAKICRRGADEDDLLEISYVGTVLETGQVFDGSTVMINGKGIPGRGGDVSLFFVLGKQPFGQFPPGWDVGLVGMCVGERRRIVIPPVLAYGSLGVPRRGIPPDATLQYDVTLVSINGNALPQ